LTAQRIVGHANVLAISNVRLAPFARVRVREPAQFLYVHYCKLVVASSTPAARGNLGTHLSIATPIWPKVLVAILPETGFEVDFAALRDATAD
jgi:hypothetical protein